MLCAILLATLTAAELDDGGFAHGSSSSDGGLPRPNPAAQPVKVKIAGALVLPSSAYLDALWLPRAARADEATAKEVRRQLQAFLERLGYELASVTTVVRDEAIEVQVDEGKIDRILYLGRLSFPQLRFKLALALPYEVFNRQLLEQQVRELSEQLGIPGVQWELVRTSAVVHEGPQFNQLPGEVDVSIAGVKLLHARRPYEVRVSFPAATGTQVGIDLRAYYIDGLEVGLNYVDQDLLGKGDRWYTAISGGIGLRPRLGNGELYPYFSRGAISARYDTVPLFKLFKPNLWAQASLVNRHRPDLNLESYLAFTVDAAIQLELELLPGVRFLLGGGYQYRRLSAFEVPPLLESPVGDEVEVRSRPFFRFTQAWVINPQVLRWDRRHTLESELERSGAAGRVPLLARARRREDRRLP
ncbi:MAG: uncharacterized protein H6Q89_1994 [Myxococcaceae bacterium]|nr:uncharacterized protein [Myxococcaceae bacterium]